MKLYLNVYIDKQIKQSKSNVDYPGCDYSFVIRNKII